MESKPSVVFFETTELHVEIRSQSYKSIGQKGEQIDPIDPTASKEDPKEAP